MPSATTLSSYSFDNLGPLTTTWTAPESCATTVPQIQLAFTEIVTYPYIYSDCNTPSQGDCVPSGTVIDAHYKSAAMSLSTSAGLGLDYMPYFSPGLACPGGWTTAGVAVKDATGSLSSTGVFAPSELSSQAPGMNFGWNILMETLDNGETAAVCCPSDFEVGYNPICYSLLPRDAFKASTGVVHIVDVDETILPATFPWNGTTVTGSSVSFLTDHLYSTCITTALESLESEDYTGYTSVMPAILVHRATDVSAAATATSTGPDDEDSSSSGPGSGAAAQSNSMIGVMTVWMVAALAGAVLLLTP
ncbi:hypothetical protein F4780DRAFT_724262 [Xylariomycetidae sp. FL0641]|nr:hypothetical protein F4780DRAFT_724262 [Xylariomycetidae sp. FL0641]